MWCALRRSLRCEEWFEGARASEGSGESEGGARGSAAEARVATAVVGVAEGRESCGAADVAVVAMDAAEGDLAMVVCVAGSW